MILDINSLQVIEISYLLRQNKRLTLTLWTWEAVGGPAEGVSICAKDRVLLLHTKPRDAVIHHGHDLFTGVAQVGLCWETAKHKLTRNTRHLQPQRRSVFVLFLLTCWLVIVLEHFTEHQLVGVFPERVPEHSYRDQEHVAVGALRLVGAGAIKVPLRKVWQWKTTETIDLSHSLKPVFTHSFTTCCYKLQHGSYRCLSSPSIVLGSESKVLVLQRSPSPDPSIQMYIAWTKSPWGRLM